MEVEEQMHCASYEQLEISVEEDEHQHGRSSSSSSRSEQYFSAENGASFLQGVSMETYINFYVPMYKAALKGDWRKAEELIAKKPELASSSLTSNGETALHLAAGAKHFTFVKEMISSLTKEKLETRDRKGNTALCFAAVSGSKDIVQLMVNMNPNLPLIRGGADMTPLYMAAVSGDRETICYLSKRSRSILRDEDFRFIFFTHLNNGLLDLALKMLNLDGKLAFARDGADEETALHFLARKPKAFTSRNQRIPGAQNGRWVQAEALELAQKLWRLVLQRDHSEVMQLIGKPPLLFMAVEHGNYELISTLISSYPQLIWETNENNHSIIHAAVLNRQVEIFRLIHEIGALKDLIVSYVDDQGNNILHLAAKSGPENQLNLISGAALQMQRELLWFQEVEKHVPPQEREKRNLTKKTPRQLFSSEHSQLLKNGEKWIKAMAKYFMVVAALVATVVYAAPFSFSNNGYFGKTTGAPFTIFSTTDSIALSTASTSILVFLFILTSRYSEKDFTSSLPGNLITGVTLLFFSIAAMVVSFSSNFFILYDRGVMGIPIMVSVFVLLAVITFLCRQIPLLILLCRSTCLSRSMFRPGKPMLC